MIRKATFESAIATNTDLIFTYVWAFDQQEDWDYKYNRFLGYVLNGENQDGHRFDDDFFVKKPIKISKI